MSVIFWGSGKGGWRKLIQRWIPPEEITSQETYLLKRCQSKRRLFAFLREQRRRLFDEQLQDELEGMYRGTDAGKDPVCPALMAMALILQGYLGVSDAEAVELTVVDLRWQMVLDRLGQTKPAFSQGALFEFRQRLIANDMDRRLLERSAEVARATNGFDAKKLPKTLRIAIDSSPLEGAGRVEDTINLIGHAARRIAKCAAKLIACEYTEFCNKVGAPLLADSSIKKALDRDWSDARQKGEAVDVVASQVLSLERWIYRNLTKESIKAPLEDLIETVNEIIAQDLEADFAAGRLRIAQRVAPDRRISIEDDEMRHGRKTKSVCIQGYKRHVATDLDSKAIVACAITSANRPEHEALPNMCSDMKAQGLKLSEAHFDRAYMPSASVGEMIGEGASIICKPWRTSNGGLFVKEDFNFNLRSKTITCPAGSTKKFTLGVPVQFDAKTCNACPLRNQCTTAKTDHGRTVNILNDEPLQHRLRLMAKSKPGRQRFRERVSVEHSLAHIAQRQGTRARYKGIRKNLFDLRRSAMIQNLETIQRNA